MEFGYEIVRLWEYDAEKLLNGALGTTPLAPLGRLSPNVSVEVSLAEIIQRLVDRLIREAPPERTKELLTASFLLTGLRIDRAAASKIFQGVRAMRESDTYMAILEEGEEKGRVEEAKRMILLMGERRFNCAPDEATKAKLSAIADNIARLEQLGQRLFDVASWAELFE